MTKIGNLPPQLPQVRIRPDSQKPGQAAQAEAGADGAAAGVSADEAEWAAKGEAEIANKTSAEPTMTRRELEDLGRDRADDAHVDEHQDDDEQRLKNEEARREREAKEKGLKVGEKQATTPEKSEQAKRRAQQEQLQRQGKDGFQQQKLSNPLTSAMNKMAETQTAKDAAAIAKAQLAQRADKPQDAMALLNQAQEPGVYFKEEREGGRQQQDAETEEERELREAIAELTAELEGVKGVVRIRAGWNDVQERIILVVTTRGFGEAQMKLVPPQVRRFSTVTVVPYDLLPLRRER